MSAAPRSISSVLTVVQIALVGISLLALGLMPPRDGPMALVALDGRSADLLAAPALANGAQLLGHGPLPNILIVRGARAALAGDMIGRGVIVVAAPQSWCGPQGSAA